VSPPTDNWGYFKVPGSIPDITDWMQKDSQQVYAHPSWKETRIRDVKKMWYQREIEIPKNWKGRRVLLKADYVNSHAVVYVKEILAQRHGGTEEDSLRAPVPPRETKKAGEILYPVGEVDLTDICEPSKKYLLTLEVSALPQAEVIAMFGDTNAPRQGTATINRRGLCGDVWLVSEPKGARIIDVKVETSVRKREITVTASLANATPFREFSGRPGATGYFFYVHIFDSSGRLVCEFGSKVQNKDLDSISFTKEWQPEKLWDIHTPENMYNLEIILTSHEEQADGSATGQRYDRFHTRFGFREFWIDGRDLYLNGKKIWLSCVPLCNAQVGAALANYDAAKESMLRLKSFGVNFVYTHNYDCNPGSFISFAEILRAADDVGMLVSFAMPHFGHFNWETATKEPGTVSPPDGDTVAGSQNGYERVASFLVREAQNHPSVIFYSMSHNATGYSEDMNPFLMDGTSAPRSRWAVNNLNKAARAKAIVQRLDPSRIIYHHASGNLGPMHISNFYGNWIPVQEMSDWFGHWATVGTKPMFTCEYGVPFTWDWAMYRGWYNGKREFGSAPVPWEFCNAEWNSQFLGDRAFQIGEPEKRNLRWEAQQFRDGKVWHRWDYPHRLGSPEFTDQDPILAKYITDNWRAFRTWGLSINSYWEHGRLWSLRSGVDKSRKNYATDWENLQRPGFSPDFQEQRYERIDLAYERDDWIPSEAAKALIRNNSPLLGYIAGKDGDFTEKGHNFFPGETVEKQFVMVNNSRESIECRYSLSATWMPDRPLVQGVVLETGNIAHIPISIRVDDTMKEQGPYVYRARFSFDRKMQDDEFTFHIMPPLEKIPAMNIALYDPQGETAQILDKLGVRYRLLGDLSSLCPLCLCESQNSSHEGTKDTKECTRTDDILIIGKNALSITDDGIDLSAVPDGLRVILFEQSAEVLEKRLGFRTAQYGLRQVFRRVADHPLLRNIANENLRDWRGESTLLPEQLDYKIDDNVFNGVPTVEWCGMTVPRVWRCGNRGTVASVLIEKPTCGDFLPILDGGFSLQYSPLMEYRHGKGLILFCQMDITGRTENDPAGLHLVGNILRYVNEWKGESNNMRVGYYGDEQGKKFLEKIGVSITGPSKAVGWTVHILGQDGINQDFIPPINMVGDVGEHHVNVKDMILSVRKSHGYGHDDRVFALGLNMVELKTTFPELTVTTAEHISTYFEPFGMESPLRGISPADVHNRIPQNYPLITDEKIAVGNGILGVTDEGRTVICGMAPWQFDPTKKGEKRTFRRSAFVLSRILGNMNVDLRTPLVERFHGTVGQDEKRWLDGLYLDEPTEWDDPYRFFRW